jgi:hypothetical protein
MICSFRHAPTNEQPFRCICDRCGKPLVPTIEVDPAGMTRVCRLGDQPSSRKMPSAPKRVWNLAKALVDFVADGCKTVSAEEYKTRLEVCETCDRREGVWCRHPDCGCNRAIKAHGRAWTCPLGKWAKPIKPCVAHIMPWDLTTGGAQRMLDLWCSQEGGRWETHVFTTGERGQWKFAGATVHAKMPQAKIAETVKTLAPDVAVFHDPLTAKYVPADCPQVWIAHCMATLGSPPPDVTRPVCLLSNLDSGINPAWRNIPIRVLPLGVDLQAFQPQPASHTGLVCGIVGRLHQDKVPESCGAALASWQPGPWRIRFVGHGLDSGYQAKTRKALAGCPWIEFAGDVLPDQMPAALNRLDALLIPTALNRGETGSYALVEAMACGLPIVARDLDGLHFNGGDAPLFAKGDAELLARLRELDDPARRAALGRRGRELAERDHDLRRHVTAHSAAYADALRVDVSILMSVYNTPADYLRESWESIQAQTCRHWELVLVDDGSTDRATVAEIDRIAADPRVRLLRLPANTGLAAALNAGLPHCRSDLVARMDADDVMLPGRLALQVAYLRAHPDVAILGAQIQADRDGKLFPPTSHPAVITRAIIDGQRAAGPKGIWFVNHPTVIFRRAAIQALGGYPVHRVAQDLALWLRAFRAGLVIHNLPDVVLRYRLHAGQLTAAGSSQAEYDAIVAEEWDGSSESVLRR